MRLSNKLLLAGFYAVLFIGLLSFGEMIARAKNYKPFRPRRLDSHEPTMFRRDPVIGWIPKPGEYVVPPYHPAGSAIRYTFLPDTSRATSSKGVPTDYDIVFVGCSYTLGWAVSDAETFAWKLQSEFPSLRIGNFGAGGYGTHQSLLRLRRIFDQGMKPSVVIYGFGPFHENRNVAPPSWLKQLAEYTRRGHVALPYCSLDGRGQLIEHPPVEWPTFPFQEYFALPQLLLSLYLPFHNQSGQLQNKGMITQKLLIEMRDLAERNDAKLIVAVLMGGNRFRRNYASFLKNHGIDVMDITLMITPDYKVPGEGHPNDRAHSYWALEIFDHLQKVPGLINQGMTATDNKRGTPPI